MKKFWLGFFDELGNFKQKMFTFQNAKFFYILQQQIHSILIPLKV